MKKIVLVDFNNISMMSLFSPNVMDKDKYEVKSIDYDYWRYSVFSSLYSYIQKYKPNEIIVAVDHYENWRKKIFPQYKEARQGTRDKFNIDWEEYRFHFDNFLQDLKTHIPFVVIRCRFCEGDDIIGSLVLNLGEDNQYVIVSSDSDFLQLSRPNVKIYSPYKQQEVSHPDSEFFLKELCLQGQKKDGIYNVVTPVDWPADMRKPPFGPKKCEKVMVEGLDEFLNQEIEYNKKYIDKDGETVYYKRMVNIKDRYDLNTNLIDLRKVPKVMVDKILEIYYNYQKANPDMIYKLFEKYNWPTYLDEFNWVEQKLVNLY